MKKYSKAIIVLFIAAAGVFILKNAGFGTQRYKRLDFHPDNDILRRYV